jgi:type IV pilus assembly protein PilV
MSGKKHSKKSHGFTLVEVLVALTILIIGILGTLMLEVSSMKGNTSSRNMQAAIVLAEDFLEQTRNTSYTSIILNNGNHTNSELGTTNPIDVQGNGGGIYSRTWSVVNDAPLINLKTITVTVGWTNKLVSHSVALTTVKVGP